MATEITNQFAGLPMASLIGGPLQAACDAQLQLANATATFIKTVGMNEDGQTIRTADFHYEQIKEDGSIQKMNIQAPLLAIVKVPNLSINNLDITFDMEVKTAEESKESSDKSGSLDAEANIGFGCFKARVAVKGSISSHQENTRSTDTSAKYHIELHAKDEGMSEGLSRVLDIMQSAIQPREIASNTKEIADSKNTESEETETKRKQNTKE
ncbi:hypothetical protein CQA53_09580 [Helicobacter didelphidarum]|uniref:DUF2589 domain-containing protein n=1 Tax=Helicobacter didelphidarum TaxID=2040648 RepID=A0A3D8IA74_9HELI|nr:DUF2589 domain-containing protein [Helicobacter didelphidarum]RDU62059.1 hypothetical protein CQA53_09580 [Helicobacter didelphidarum]